MKMKKSEHLLFYDKLVEISGISLFDTSNIILLSWPVPILESFLLEILKLMFP